MSWRILLLCGSVIGCGPVGSDKSDEDDDEDAGDDGPLALAIVLDNSASMGEEAAALALALPALDAARGDRELRVVALGPSVEFTGGWSDGVDPGEAGVPIAAARSSDDPDWVLGLTRDLLCDLSTWQSSAVPDDPSYTCDPGEPALPDVVSREYLDCLCGSGEWEGNPAGSGNEEPLEAVLLLGCRSAAEPPEACFDPLSPFADSTGLAVTDWPGEDVLQVHALLVSDEGDNSRRLATGEDTPGVYLEAFAALPVPPTVSGIGLVVDAQTGGSVCPSTTVPSWSLNRVMEAAAQTGGGYWPIAEGTDGGDCVTPDLSPALTEWLETRGP